MFCAKLTLPFSALVRSFGAMRTSLPHRHASWLLLLVAGSACSGNGAKHSHHQDPSSTHDSGPDDAGTELLPDGAIKSPVDGGSGDGDGDAGPHHGLDGSIQGDASTSHDGGQRPDGGAPDAGDPFQPIDPPYPMPVPDVGLCGVPSAGCACPLAGFPGRAWDLPEDGDALAVGDVNGDNTPDLVTGDDSDGVQVLFNTGHGTFIVGGQYDGKADGVPALGDINGDGKTDIAVADHYVRTISVYLNTGNGTFAAKVDYTGGNTQPDILTDAPSLALVDMNGDKHTDIVTPLSVLLNQGDGTFGAPKVYSTGKQVLVADFNGDKKPDVASLDSAITVSLNAGDGTLKASGYVDVVPNLSGAYAAYLAVADFNGDHKLDLVGSYINFQEDSIGGVSVALGKGDGTFAQPVAMWLKKFSTNVTTADVTGDGKQDIVVSITRDADLVYVLPGKGDGTFGDPVTYYLPSNDNVVAADLDGNGTVELVAASGDKVMVLDNPGHGSLRTAQGGDVWTPYGVAVGDIDEDGYADVVSADVQASEVDLLLGAGDGTFKGPYAKLPAGMGPRSVVIGDLNDDHTPDLVSANGKSGDVSVLLGKGKGAFADAASYPAHTTPTSLVLGDLDGDQKNDLVVANWGSSDVSVLLNQGQGVFAAAKNYAVARNPTSLALGDVDGDSKPDLVVVSYNGRATLLHNQGDGTFVTQAVYATGAGGVSVALADLDGDKQNDFAVANPARDGATLTVLLNQGKGVFGPRINYPFGRGTGIAALVVGDFNGDGLPDLAGVDASSSRVALLANTGGGIFGAPVPFGAPVKGVYDSQTFAPTGLALGDFNGDELPDLALAGAERNEVSLLLNAPSCVK
jgi:hypothetical protein